MTKEEFFSTKEWELIFSGSCAVATWGKHVVHLKHISGRTTHGYGDNEEVALVNAIEIASKTPVVEIHKR